MKREAPKIIKKIVFTKIVLTKNSPNKNGLTKYS